MAPPKNFGFGDDEQLLRDQARKFLDEHASIDKIRKLVGEDHDAVYVRGDLPQYDKKVWNQAVELGWTGLAVPEDAGGLGIAAIGVASLIEEVGRHAFPSPLVATVCATYVLKYAGSDAAKAWLGKVAEGATLSLADTDSEGSWETGDVGVSAESDGEGLLLNGSAHFVQDALKVDGFVVAAKQGDGLVLCVVPKDAAGLTVERDHIHDLTRDQAHLGFSGVKVAAADVVAAAATGAGALEAALPSILVMVAADLCGTAEWLMLTTVEYAKVRTQFDRPIGFFQAVKHPLVNAMMENDRARSHMANAASSVDHEPQNALMHARMAKSQASDASAFMSNRAVQLHGGIGFTWECDVHLFFKRGMHNEALYGNAQYQREKLADMLIGPIGG